jgi:hypothetical protein
MKKKLVIGGVALLLLIIIISSVSKNDQVNKAFEAGKKDAAQNLNPTPSVTTINKTAILSGKDESGKVDVQDISIWMKPGSGGVDNVTAGTVPTGTKVEVLGSTTVENVLFYHIKSSVGVVDVLPTDPSAREKAKATKPQSEWTVEADPSFPVDGWVTADFVTNIK